MKEQIKSYFSFSKKELNGLLVLFILITMILSFPFCYRIFGEQEEYDLDAFHKEIEAFKASAVIEKGRYNAFREKLEEQADHPEYFEFDPNTASSSEWSRLGLSQKQIKVLKNYLSKGGKFYKNEDLRKIYSITERQYVSLEPYIRIAVKNTPYDDRQLPVTKYLTKQAKPKLSIMEINAADSSMLDALRGIGPAFASRIVRYRTRLGGFNSKEQLREVYGMDSLRYSQLATQISVDPLSVRKLNINTANFEELRGHPYLTFKQINALIQYRKQHGNYSGVADLRKVLILNEEIIRKIEPYLSFDP